MAPSDEGITANGLKTSHERISKPSKKESEPLSKYSESHAR